MDYDKIIVDMLNRICILEEQVKKLTENKQENEMKVTTADIKKYITGLKQEALRNGADSIEIVSNDVHKALKLTNRMPLVCNAMRQVMTDNDVIAHQTPSGNSSTLKIKYFLK